MRVFLSRLFVFFIVIGFSTCDEPEKPKPAITTVDPALGVVGQPIKITGKNFGSATAVLFGIVSSDIVTKTATEILTVLPPGVLPGTIVITVKADKQISNEVSFTVLENIPEITSIEPSKGSSGMEIVIKGKYFQSISSVSFGSTHVTSFVSKSDTEAKVVVPAGLPLGALDVTVTTGGGSSEKSTFVVFGKPEVTSISPVIGPVGKVVTIKGINFDEVSGVFFGNGSAQFKVNSLTEIEATVPASATTGKVKVVTPGGEALSADDYTVKDAPQITSFTPTTGIAGATITINGSNFDAPGLTVKFGTGTASAPTLVDAGKITVKVPASATTGKVTVTTAAGSATSTDNFAVIGAPTITSFTPANGLAGVQVTINGASFISVIEVKFNETVVAVANYTVVSETQIKATVPAGATSGKISVKAAGGTAVSASSFTVNAPPAITGFSPDKGQRNSEVVINGSAFSDATSVKIGGVELGSANYTINSNSKITARVTAAAITGKISVSNAAGTATSANTFSIYPYIDALDNNTANAGGELTITGTNLGGSKVYFNTTEVTPTSNTAVQVKVTIPANISGAFNVSVANNVGTSNTKPLTVTNLPVLTEVVAEANIKEELVLLSGSNLTGATKVWFGNTSVNKGDVGFYYSTAKVILALIPSLALGKYDVKIETANGMSNSKQLEIISQQPYPPNGVTLATGTYPSLGLPGGYVPPVANLWKNSRNTTEEHFLISPETGNTLSVRFTKTYSQYEIHEYQGTGSFDLLNNYIEFTVAGDRYVGMWGSPWYKGKDNEGKDCYKYHQIILISTESGKQLELQFYNEYCTYEP